MLKSENVSGMMGGMKEYEIVKHLQMEDLNLFLVEMTYRSPHMHKEFEICMVLSGEVSVYANREAEVFGKGDVILCNPHQTHELHALTENVVLLSVQIASGFCVRAYPDIRRVEFDNIHLTFEEDREALWRLRELLLKMAELYLGKEENYEFFCMSRLYEVFGILLCTQKWHRISGKEQTERYHKGKRLNRITDYIESHFTEKIMLTDIAGTEHLSMHYLSHFFKEMLGIPFQQYVALMRFERARKLVERTNKSITEICLECGFSDYRYLNKIYKKQLGYTPMEYRKCHTVRAEEEKNEDVTNTQTFYSARDSLEFLRLARQSRTFSTGPLQGKPGKES